MICYKLMMVLRLASCGEVAFAQPATIALFSISTSLCSL